MATFYFVFCSNCRFGEAIDAVVQFALWARSVKSDGGYVETFRPLKWLQMSKAGSKAKLIMSNNKQSIVSLLNPMLTFRGIYISRDLLWQLLKRNIQMRFTGSVFGALWLVIMPLVMLSIYTFVFSVIFKARWSGGGSTLNVAMMVFCGMSVFNIFSESTSLATSSVSSNPNYVKKVVFPLEIIPATASLTSFLLGALWFVVLLASIIITGQKFHLTVICLPLLLLPLLLCSWGVAYLVASLGVYLKDMTHIVIVMLQILFWATPIVYPLDMIPKPLRSLLRLNPLGWIIQQTRKVLLLGEWPSWLEYGCICIVSLLVFQLGFVWFMKTKRGFADVL